MSQGLPSIGIRKGLVARNDHIVKRKYKEVGVCCACGTYKHKAIFYDWYVHPAIKSLFRKDEWHIGMICLKCARREAGTKHRNKL